MQMRIASSVAAAAVVGMAIATAAQAAPIRVNVNGAPIAFTGTPPIEIKGAVLVPLRGVFQALGATVNYNPVTKVINAEKGSSTVVLALGQAMATVNGQTQSLSQPAQAIGGTTLVPLRFVAQALGAYVQWVAAASTVEITTAEPHLSTLPAAPGTGNVVGQVTGVYTDTNPQQVTVRLNGIDHAVRLSPSTIILRSAPGEPATQVPLSEIQPGDQVRVTRDAAGNALSVTATSGEVRGTIKSISGKQLSGDRTITLNDGSVVSVASSVPVTMARRHVTLSDIMPNEEVVIRTDSTNKQGFGIAVVTPNNPNPIPPGKPQSAPAGAVSINSFSDDAQGPLKAGDHVTATLVGTPGCAASFSIPGVVESVPMRESSAGLYTGTYAVPKNVNVVGAAVLGALTRGGIAAPLVQAAGTLSIDTTAPKITDFSPARGATTESAKPLIYATISDAGGLGVNVNSVHIAVDGKDVTKTATVTPAFFNFTPSEPLANGAHTVEVSVEDRAGNFETTKWRFTVAPSELVQSFTSSAVAGSAVGVGQTVRFTLKAQPHGHAEARIGSGAAIPLIETAPGIYSGEYTAKAGESAQNAPVTAEFTAANGQTTTAPLATSLTIAAGPPTTPKITSPAENATVGDTVDVAGKAAPGATVRLTVDYSTKALGIFNLTGSSGTTEVTADKDGRWKAVGLSLQANRLLSGQATVFTITAVVVAPNGDISDPAILTVRRG